MELLSEQWLQGVVPRSDLVHLISIGKESEDN